MALLGTLRAGGIVLLVSPLLIVGCVELNAYRPDAEVTESRYATIVNYSTTPIDPDRVDDLFIEVADILGTQLDPAVPLPRIVVTTPDRIASLYEPKGRRLPWDLQARALYFPDAGIVMIPYFDRSLLGHELAHYLTEHYATAPRSEWERIADGVEWKLAFGTRKATVRAPVLTPARRQQLLRPPRLTPPR